QVSENRASTDDEPSCCTISAPGWSQTTNGDCAASLSSKSRSNDGAVLTSSSETCSSALRRKRMPTQLTWPPSTSASRPSGGWSKLATTAACSGSPALS